MRGALYYNSGSFVRTKETLLYIMFPKWRNDRRATGLEPCPIRCVVCKHSSGKCRASTWSFSGSSSVIKTFIETAGKLNVPSRKQCIFWEVWRRLRMLCWSILACIMFDISWSWMSVVVSTETPKRKTSRYSESLVLKGLFFSKMCIITYLLMRKEVLERIVIHFYWYMWHGRLCLLVSFDIFYGNLEQILLSDSFDSDR